MPSAGSGKAYKAVHGAKNPRPSVTKKSGGSINPVKNKSSMGMGKKPVGNAAPKNQGARHLSRAEATKIPV